jgi:hypothetical protein
MAGIAPRTIRVDSASVGSFLALEGWLSASPLTSDAAKLVSAISVHATAGLGTNAAVRACAFAQTQLSRATVFVRFAPRGAVRRPATTPRRMTEAQVEFRAYRFVIVAIDAGIVDTRQAALAPRASFTARRAANRRTNHRAGSMLVAFAARYQAAHAIEPRRSTRHRPTARLGSSAAGTARTAAPRQPSCASLAVRRARGTRPGPARVLTGGTGAVSRITAAGEGRKAGRRQ